MKTNNYYSVPSLSSLEEHEITDLMNINAYQEELRLVQLPGVPVRIRIDKDYVELTSNEDEIDLSFYKEIFSKLMNFFYGVGYIFGYVSNNKLLVYDIYTNNNFFSTKDLAIMERDYNLPIVSPIIEGNFTPDCMIEILNKKINNEKIPADELFILPSVYINDTRIFTFSKNTEISKVILGEKKVYTYPINTWTNQSAQLPKTPVITPVNNAKTKEPNDFDDVYSLSTKEERTAIYNETYKNVSKYVEKNKKVFDKPLLDWWKKNGKYLTYLYSIHTLPSTRKILWDYSKTYCLDYISKFSSLTEKWAEFFELFFEDNYFNFIFNKINIDDYFCSNFEKIFHEELLEIDKFYVKENSKSADWRY